LSKRKVKEAENNLKKNMINFSVQNAEKLLKSIETMNLI